MCCSCHVDNIISCNIRSSVTGYDPTLPLDDIESKLCEHFSPSGFPQAGSFAYKTGDGLNRFVACMIIYSEAFVYVIGEDAVEKALELSGRSVGGLNIVATRILPHEPIICGFSPARTLIRFLILF